MNDANEPSNDHPPENLLTLAEAGAELKVGEQSVRRIVKSGALRAYRVGRGLRIARADLDRYLSNGRTS